MRGSNLRADRGSCLLKLLRRGAPPIARVASAREAYGGDGRRVPHYVVIKAVDEEGSLEIAGPWYDKAIPKGYWEGWSGSMIAVEGGAR